MDGPEPHVRGVGVSPCRQEVSVRMSDPGDCPVAHPAHPTVEDGGLAQDGRDVPGVSGVKHRDWLGLMVRCEATTVVYLVLQLGQAPAPTVTVTVVNLIKLGRLSAQQRRRQS